jgi:hypothetical protein
MYEVHGGLSFVSATTQMPVHISTSKVVTVRFTRIKQIIQLMNEREHTYVVLTIL